MGEDKKASYSRPVLDASWENINVPTLHFIFNSIYLPCNFPRTRPGQDANRTFFYLDPLHTNIYNNDFLSSLVIRINRVKGVFSLT